MFRNWTLFEKSWLLVFTLINFYLLFRWDDSFLGLITSITGMFCVVLAAKGKIANYYFGIIQTATYAYLSFSYGLYGETMLNALFYFPLQFIGMALWRRNQVSEKVKGEDIQVKRLTSKSWMKVLATFTVLFVFYAFLLSQLGGKSVWIDSATTILSIIAQVLMLQRYAEQWLFWITVNVLSILLWITVLAIQGAFL